MIMPKNSRFHLEWGLFNINGVSYTIETQVTSRSLTYKKRSAEFTDDLRSVVDHLT
jgi:hypothetical protein